MGAYAAFNVTDYCEDDPQRVASNRLWLAGELGIEGERLVMPRQTHSDRIEEITAETMQLSVAQRRDLLDASMPSSLEKRDFVSAFRRLTVYLFFSLILKTKLLQPFMRDGEER